MSHSNAENLSRPLRVLQLTDLHLTTDPDAVVMGVATQPSLRRVLAAASARPDPDVLLLTGDLTHDEPAAIARLPALLDRFRCPVLLTAGNHDDSQELIQAALPERWQVNATVERDNWCLLSLDTSVRGRVEGHLDAAALDQLDGRLRECGNRHVLLALHHPPIAVGTAWLDRIGLDNGAQLLDRLRQYPNLRVIAFGHAHQAFAGRAGDIALLGTPSTCAQFLPGATEFAIDSNAAPGARILELFPDGRVATEVFRAAAGTVQ